MAEASAGLLQLAPSLHAGGGHAAEASSSTGRPQIRCIFLSKFDVTLGPKLVLQSPLDFIAKVNSSCCPLRPRTTPFPEE